ncbi:MAG: aminotransferase class V-fold PLP-dependent enzyme [Candidatus Omnitrophica bacterium]|nr:aminotransferase class V-fold PLP-dependent enzyme [Candidatus Omnitrophota bacterium]
MSTFWKKIRKDFPITKRCIYLDHASAGPMCRPAVEAYRKYSRVHQFEADLSWPQWLAKREAVRKKTAAFIGADPAEITFTTSTSHGMNLIAELLAGQGTVLTNESEFPSSTVPWIWRRAKLVFQKSHAGRIDLKELRKQLKPPVKTVVSSFVQYSSGFKQDLNALGALKGSRYFVVNATQGFGAFELDVEKSKIDFLCTNSYKWMMAGYGGGILYIRKKWLERFEPDGAGWRSMKNPDLMNNRLTDLRVDAARYEWGCPPFASIFAFGAAVEYFSQIGIQNISRRILELTDFLIRRLEEEGVEVISPKDSHERSGIVIFKTGQVQKVWRRLFDQGVYVLPRGEGIRVAPHFYNTLEEIDLFVEKLVRVQKKMKAGGVK